MRAHVQPSPASRAQVSLRLPWRRNLLQMERRLPGGTEQSRGAPTTSVLHIILPALLLTLRRLTIFLLFFIFVCLLDPPPPHPPHCLFIGNIISPPERRRWLGARVPRGEAVVPLFKDDLIPSTPSSVISSCGACDVLPSIHLYKHLAGRRQGPLRASFICSGNAKPAAEDHITPTSVRRMLRKHKGVCRR